MLKSWVCLNHYWKVGLRHFEKKIIINLIIQTTSVALPGEDSALEGDPSLIAGAGRRGGGNKNFTGT